LIVLGVGDKCEEERKLDDEKYRFMVAHKQEGREEQ
jgi:hypothetical protein